MRKAIRDRILKEAGQTKSNQYQVRACDCGSCDKPDYMCVECGRMRGLNETVIVPKPARAVCYECFDYWYTMKQLGGTDG